MGLSTCGYALLTLLAREPLSGYDLAQRMKKPLGFFWQARHSQIYPELARLEKLGCVVHEVVVLQDHPMKKLYTITDAGRSMLQAWVSQPGPPDPERNTLLLKTYAIWLAEQEQALKLYQTRERLYVEHLARFQDIQATIEQKCGGVPRPDDPCFGDYATVRLGVASTREHLAWCRWMIAQFEQALASHHQDTP